MSVRGRRETARTYHAFWSIVNASYDPALLRALTLDARRRYALQDALRAHDDARRPPMR